MKSVIQSFSDGYKIATQIFPLMLVPFALDLISMVGRLTQLPSNTTTYGFKFSMPVYLPSLSDVYNFHSGTGAIQIGNSPIPSSEPLIIALPAALLFTALLAFLAGGYLGTMDSKRRETQPVPSFFGLCTTHFPRLFGYGLLWLLVISPVALFILSNMLGLAIVYIFFVFIVDYFLFLTPFAIVVDGSPFGAALSKSVSIALHKPNAALPYVLIYAILTAVVSVPIYALMNAGVTGYLIDAAIYSVVGTILVSATLAFYSEVSSGPPPCLSGSEVGRSESPMDQLPPTSMSSVSMDCSIRYYTSFSGSSFGMLRFHCISLSIIHSTYTKCTKLSSYLSRISCKLPSVKH